MEIFQTQIIREPVESSRVRGEVVVCDFPIPTLTETLPVLSPGTVSAVLGESRDTEKDVIGLRSYTPSLLACLWRRRTLFRISQLLHCTSMQGQSSFTCSQVTQQRAATTTSQFSPQLPTSQFPSLANKTQIPSLVTDYWGSGI